MKLILYRPADSVLHGMDPRIKLVSLALFCAGVLLFNDPLLLVWPLAVLVGLSFLGRVARSFAVGTLVIVIIGGLSFLIWPLFLSLRGFGGAQAWIFGTGVGLRLVEMLLAGLLLLLTTRTEEVLAALSRMGLPFPAVFSLGLTFRLLPTLLSTANNVVEAQRLRGLRFDEGGLVKRARRYVPLLVPILACSLRSAHRMAWALEAKGFGSSRARTSFIVLSMRKRDWFLLVLSILLLILAFVLRMRGIGVLPFGES